MERLGGSICLGQRLPDNPGVALYFQKYGKPMVMACDDFSEPESNVRRLALAIKAMRDLARNGGGTMMERAFSGFSALPAPIKMGEDWTVTLNFVRPSRAEEINSAFKRLARQCHSDKTGGDDEKMTALNLARTPCEARSVSLAPMS